MEHHHRLTGFPFECTVQEISKINKCMKYSFEKHIVYRCQINNCDFNCHMNNFDENLFSIFCHILNVVIKPIILSVDNMHENLKISVENNILKINLFDNIYEYGYHGYCNNCDQIIEWIKQTTSPFDINIINDIITSNKFLKITQIIHKNININILILNKVNGNKTITFTRQKNMWLNNKYMYGILISNQTIISIVNDLNVLITSDTINIHKLLIKLFDDHKCS